MFHSWIITIRCDQCNVEYKLRMPVMLPLWFDSHNCNHCTRKQMKELVSPAKDLHDDCSICHPEQQPPPVVTWKGRKTPIGGVWGMKVVDGVLHVELERPKKKRSPKKP